MPLLPFDCCSGLFCWMSIAVSVCFVECRFLESICLVECQSLVRFVVLNVDCCPDLFCRKLIAVPVFLLNADCCSDVFAKYWLMFWFALQNVNSYLILFCWMSVDFSIFSWMSSVIPIYSAECDFNTILLTVNCCSDLFCWMLIADMLVLHAPKQHKKT